MQELHLVGMTRDLDGLIFSSRKGAKSGSFVVPIDPSLIEVLGSATRLRRERREAEDRKPAGGSGLVDRHGALGLRAESRLTPRDIQSRLRAGHSIEQVARAAGVPREWVERFAPPVVAEQERVVTTALGLKSTKNRVGHSVLGLAESVRMNLYDKGVPLVPEPGGWSASNLDGTRWLVRFEFVSRGRPQRAEWELDFEERSVTPRNRTATELGYVDAVRGRRRVPKPAPLPAAGKDAPAAAVVAVAETGLDGSADAEATPDPPKPPAAPRRRKVRSRPAAKKAPAKKAPAKKAPAKKAPAKKAPAKKAPAKKAPAKKAAARR